MVYFFWYYRQNRYLALFFSANLSRTCKKRTPLFSRIYNLIGLSKFILLLFIYVFYYGLFMFRKADQRWRTFGSQS